MSDAGPIHDRQELAGHSLAYAAGFLDGEGCFGYYARCLRLECNHTHKPTLEFMCKLFGGVVREVKMSNSRYKQQYNWRLCGLKAAITINKLIPHLREKKDKAEQLVRQYKEGRTTGKTWDHARKLFDL